MPSTTYYSAFDYNRGLPVIVTVQEQVNTQLQPVPSFTDIHRLPSIPKGAVMVSYSLPPTGVASSFSMTDLTPKALTAGIVSITDDVILTGGQLQISKENEGLVINIVQKYTILPKAT